MESHIQLSNGIEIPGIGLGTWQITNREQLGVLLNEAYQIGYRLIDTAAAYSNEISLGKGILKWNLPRRELFLTDKVWNSNRGFQEVQDACRTSLKKLKTDYLDLYLVHWPASMAVHENWEEINDETWRGMEQLYQDGLVRAIGVCNFRKHHLLALQKAAKILPMINQVELHPGMPQLELLEYCKKIGIAVEASSPLGLGQVLKNEIILDIAKSKEKSAAQICLRWEVQKGVIVIPRTTNKERLKENIDLWDFDLSQEEMCILDDIPYCGGLGIDPDTTKDLG